MPRIKMDQLPRPYAYLDPASGRKVAKRPNARSALVVACYFPPAVVLVLYAWAARASTTELTEQLFFVNQTYRPVQLAIETAGQQYLLYSHVTDEALRRGIRLPLVEGKQYTEDAKDQRIKDAVQPLLVQGRLAVQSHQLDLRQELTDYPRGATKDILDALAGCVSLMPKPQAVMHVQDSKQAILDYLRRANVPVHLRERYLVLDRGRAVT